MARRSTGNISAVKRGTEQARPQHGSNPTVRGVGPGRGHALWAGWPGVGVSFSFVCSHFFLQDQDQVPDEGGRTVQRYSLSFRRVFGWGNLWRVPQKPIRACCGTAGLHACNVVGSAAIQFNGSLGPRRASSPSLSLVGGCWSCRHSQVLTTGSACSHAVPLCSREQ